MPKPGDVLATCPCRRSLVSPSQSAIAKPVSTGSGMGISTKQPPTLKSEALPQITGCPSQCSSTEIEHFIRGERRRSTAEGSYRPQCHEERENPRTASPGSDSTALSGLRAESLPSLPISYGNALCSFRRSDRRFRPV